MTARTKGEEGKERRGGEEYGIRNETYDNSPMLNRVSVIPVVCARARSTSSGVGMYPGAEIRSDSAKKLQSVSRNSNPSRPSKKGGHGKRDVLRSIIHQIKVRRTLHQFRNDGVAPEVFDCFCDIRVEGEGWICGLEFVRLDDPNIVLWRKVQSMNEQCKNLNVGHGRSGEEGEETDLVVLV